MREVFLVQSVQLVFAGVQFLLARWLFEISSPRADWRAISRWHGWYYLARPLELYHQFRAYLILRNW